MGMNRMMEEALLFAGFGWRVLPLKPGFKLPAISAWPKRATTNAESIREWWSKWPEAGIGILTGQGLAVLDVDQHGEDGEKTLRALLENHGPLPVTAIARTASGGRHIYFRGEVGRRIGFLAGLDMIGRGGYVAAPPTKLASGGAYDWIVDPLTTPLAPIPEWLIPPEREPLLVSPSPHHLAVTSGGAIGKGHRHNALVHQSARLRHLGTPPDQLVGELLAFNQEHCVPPQDESEVREIAGWALSRPSFEEEFASLSRAWEHPEARQRGLSRWKAAQALLKHARRARSTTISPAQRRLALDANLSRPTVQKVLGSLTDSGQISAVGRPLKGRPQAWKLHPVALRQEGPPLLVKVGVGDVSAEARGVGHKRGKREQGGAEAALLAFRGRENALRIFLLLDADRPSTVKELAARTGLPSQTIRDNLNWLESIRAGTDNLGDGILVGGIPWVDRGGTRDEVYACVEPSEDDFYDLASNRGATQQWADAWLRYQLDERAYDVYFRDRYGWDRWTGELG